MDSRQLAHLSTYLGLLLRWNAKINLTAIRSAEECVTRNFGESLFLGAFETLEGRVLDVGSGAGFPGLALKIFFPATEAVLLEPVAKKRAFLKEVIRACDFRGVEVRHERFCEIASATDRFDAITARAVGALPALVADTSNALASGGKLHLWLSREQAEGLPGAGAGIDWIRRKRVPLSARREIVTGVKIS